jgi:hypothetical protein
MQEQDFSQEKDMISQNPIPEAGTVYYPNYQNNQDTPNYEQIQSETLDLNNNNDIINSNSNNTYSKINPIINNIENQNNSQLIKENAKLINPYEIISFFSWILFISSKWNSYNMSIKCSDLKMSGNYRPMLFDPKFYDLISLLICIAGFLNYMIQIIYKRNNNLYDSLFGKSTKFHFIPLIFYSILNIIKEAAIVTINKPYNITSYNTRKCSAAYHLSNSFDPKALYTLYLILNILTLLLLIILYIKTEMNCEWHSVMTIKKGIYSILIVEVWYQIFDSIFSLRLIDVTGDDDAKTDFLKMVGIFFNLIIGGGVLLFSFLFKNITVLFFNLIMYLAMIIAFYGVKRQDHAIKEKLNGDTEGILEILILVVDFLFIIVMIIKYKNQLVES